MGAYRDENNNGKWICKLTYRNWKGEKIVKKKRGFKTKKEALEWERNFLIEQGDSIDMTLEEFYQIYKRDKFPRLRRNTINTKEIIVENKILPYLGKIPINNITKVQIIQWQNELMVQEDNQGNKYAKTYLRTIHAQLSCILNHACKYYNLKTNIANEVEAMGEKEPDEMKFWTNEEYSKFSEVMKDKPQSFYAFEILYWCGIRMGELLALTKDKFDFKKNTIRIDQSLQNIKGELVITQPKTKKGIRTITMPDFLADELKIYLDGFYKLGNNDLIFTFSKSYLHHEMDRGARIANIKRIRVHDLRHSHVSLLVELGFNATAIAERVGHESVRITYKYAHLFPTKQTEMASHLNKLRRDEDNDWNKLLEEEE